MLNLCITDELVGPNIENNAVSHLGYTDRKLLVNGDYILILLARQSLSNTAAMTRVLFWWLYRARPEKK